MNLFQFLNHCDYYKYTYIQFLRRLVGNRRGNIRPLLLPCVCRCDLGACWTLFRNSSTGSLLNASFNTLSTNRVTSILIWGLTSFTITWCWEFRNSLTVFASTGNFPSNRFSRWTFRAPMSKSNTVSWMARLRFPVRASVTVAILANPVPTTLKRLQVKGPVPAILTTITLPSVL